jgi:hypothetical protein
MRRNKMKVFEKRNILKLLLSIVVLLFIYQTTVATRAYNKPATDINEPYLPTFQDSVAFYIHTLEFEHPHIVLAQAKLETGDFRSRIFKENNNLFGMKMPRRRATTAIGSKHSHAKYPGWEHSVIDLRLYYGIYMEGKSEKEVYAFLRRYYAEDPNYINKLKTIIEREQLENRFQSFQTNANSIKL